jgi:starch synthase (maltosyl-transferring)
MPANARRAARAVDRDAGRRRVALEQLLPEIDAGRFAIKRSIGEPIDVIAHAHADGHDVLDVRLRHRARSDPPAPWTEVEMVALGNDEWRASFVPGTIGAHEYTVTAWIDAFLSWRRALQLKSQAGVDVAVELQEGAHLVAAAVDRCDADADPDREQLAATAALIGSDGDPLVRVHAALDHRLVELMRRHADRRLASDYPRALPAWVDRERARFGAWYEMFPRSWGPSPARAGTLLEAAHHLPNIAALGFDVVYLPPIHPIGTSFRKGRGNALVAEPGDPGSPWAIGSDAGGHKSVEPSLGTLDDFDAFVATAAELGLEIALDLAYQCSPDHPYVKTHPEWFRHRADGTIKYAENPPKKYQDIYPFDFESDDWRGLWKELLSIVTFWIGHGVRIFRVDNPHTKPYRFWEWLIAEIRRSHPETIFLSEAFTRPKVMGYLAKLGFTQSYSYFTWRNSQNELRDYFTELTAPPLRDYLRPNLFANTPDILHQYLQEGGPPAFKTRLVLAATLGANYGIYSGFELCEGRAVPGTEEYLDSEKYQIRQWDWERPGHIKPLVALVNRIRREHTALQFDGLLFHESDNPELIAYTRHSPCGRDVLLVIVSLDPCNMQHGFIQVPSTAFGLADGPFRVRDRLTDAAFDWRGERHYVQLHPELPAHILTVVT